MRKFVAIGLLFCALPLGAHHGNATHFDADKPVSLNAVVTDVAFVNPHAYVYFDVVGDDGELVPWRCEMAAATTLKRRGWHDGTLAPGQTITINGSLARREKNHCVVTSLVLEDGLEVSRNTDLSGYRAPAPDPTIEAEPQDDRLAKAAREQPNFSGNWVTLGIAFGGRLAMGTMGGMRMGPGTGSENVTATPAGLAAAEGYDPNFDNPNLKCQASNIIMAVVRDSHVNQIIQKEDSVQLNFGYMNVERTVHLDTRTHPDDIEPSLEGHSVGRWDGPTLIVDSVGFLPGVYGGNGNLMTSEQMHITEHYSFDVASRQLVREYTVEDPLYLDGIIRGTHQLEMTDEPYEEYGCKELSGSNNQRS